MINLLKKYYLLLIGGIAGAIGGYMYFYFVGCGTNACAISSNPYISILFGIITGMLICDIFRKK